MVTQGRSTLGLGMRALRRHCPSCGQTLSAAGESHGIVTVCVHCDALIVSDSDSGQQRPATPREQLELMHSDAGSDIARILAFSRWTRQRVSH